MNWKPLVPVVIAAVVFVGLWLLLRKREKPKSCDLRVALRDLWYDHVLYTRLYIGARLGNDQPASAGYAARLMKNQEEIGAAMGSVYGKEAGDLVTKLLKEHIQGAVMIVNHALAGDAEAQKAAVEAWYRNADEIAVALGQLNSQYAPGAKEMMYIHLDKTLKEFSLMKQSTGSPEDIANFDAVVADILAMSDMLWSGINQ